MEGSALRAAPAPPPPSRPAPSCPRPRPRPRLRARAPTDRPPPSAPRGGRLRIVFEVKRDAEAAVVLNNLYKRTALQQSFAGNMMAVLGGGRMPELLTLRRALLEFIEFRVECVQARRAARPPSPLLPAPALSSPY